MTVELGKLKRCFDVNKLSLNLNKTKFMIYGNRKTPFHISGRFKDRQG